jgi:hypothetical protein
MQSLRSLPMPCASVSLMGITVSIAQTHSLGSAAPVLNPDRADFDLEAVVLEDNAVIVTGLGMNDLAEVQIH